MVVGQSRTYVLRTYLSNGGFLTQDLLTWTLISEHKASRREARVLGCSLFWDVWRFGWNSHTGPWIKPIQPSHQSMVHSDPVSVQGTAASGSETHALLSSREGAPSPWHGSLLCVGPPPPLYCLSSTLGSVHTPYCGPWVKDSTRDNFSDAPESGPSSAQPALPFLLFLILCGLPPNPNNLMTNYPTAKLNWLLHQIPWIIGKGKRIAH